MSMLGTPARVLPWPRPTTAACPPCTGGDHHSLKSCTVTTSNIHAARLLSRHHNRASGGGCGQRAWQYNTADTNSRHHCTGAVAEIPPGGLLRRGCIPARCLRLANVALAVHGTPAIQTAVLLMAAVQLHEAPCSDDTTRSATEARRSTSAPHQGCARLPAGPDAAMSTEPHARLPA